MPANMSHKRLFWIQNQMQPSFLISAEAIPCMEGLGTTHAPASVLWRGVKFFPNFLPFGERACHNATHNLNSNEISLNQPLT